MCGIIVTAADNNVENNILKHRGPDATSSITISEYNFIFNRLSIIDVTDRGQQPFDDENITLVCNGEIYNNTELKEEYQDYDFKSMSDCEVLMPLFSSEEAVIACNKLDAEFALVYYDKRNNSLVAARDPLGIRPLFMGFDNKKRVSFASEVKALAFCEEIVAFPPGHVYSNGKMQRYTDLSDVEFINDEQKINESINELLTSAVRKRLVADVNIGFLLSGGLDSSVVCAIASKLTKSPIRTFAIGMKNDAIDLKYAKQVADFIGSQHSEVFITEQDVIDHIDKSIYHLETWDITTIRAAIGMFLVCKYIKENTDIKVLLTGEVSDELFGYKYTDFAPNAQEFQKEAEKRIKEIYMYDVLRADRCISAHGIEARVPFSDKRFVRFVMSIDPTLKMNTNGVGKFLLRRAFKDSLPEKILWREKAAFSDAVGHSLVDCIKNYAEAKYSDDDLNHAIIKYDYCVPFTKESLLYRDIFENHFSGRANLIKDFWMPNKLWPNCDVSDPSARVLRNYGNSGK